MEFTTENGAEVVINEADFISSLKLKSAVLKAIKESGVDIAKIDLEKITIASLEPIIAIVLSADTSDDVQKAIFKCLLRCTYNKEKITESVFEKTAARKDYYEIVIACLKENLAPFFASPILKLKSLAPKASESQK